MIKIVKRRNKRTPEIKNVNSFLKNWKPNIVSFVDSEIWPNFIFGIKNKGYIKEGFDADFTIVDMKKIIEIKNENIESKCKWSPFHGYKFKGTPVTTIINGDIKMKDGKILGEPSGKPMNFK